ncbi:MAG: monovalent cation/H+ antiporter subunit D family protein [gamma proteobacterium symbiont of Bathyaustriella thionipta]|nr:monovalent cation/H+ antiporter subunit D family protein [gamma proteobacterium symbiont of Bathyaustriella thionipta]MCU7952417.1 monovalent cation/H+ antiporter subunit D family protein [gamma proteobacterium symbiont of Bathyaustriella thionipta]MCU7956644.1 monovalent cation/H+ antiporter subunit D family protein [gamma proteobacterium symbiont of Bathyaustriella thionipta]MCU7968028.1 monovalent cation/H+ antiporter subunit D family protein [gamma proteobacterium symbiont of Bathyaustrie
MIISLESMLQLSIILPLLATLAIVITGRNPNLRETLSIGTALVVIYFVVNLYLGIKQGETIQVHWWELLPGLQISFNIEPLGLIFALIASFLWPITTVYSIGYMRTHKEQNQTRFYACFAIAIGSVMGIAFAANLFTLFIFYEVLTLSTYPLVTHAGTEEAKRGGRIYLGVLLGTSIVFFLFAIISTWFVAGTLDFKPGGVFNSNVNTTVASVILILFIFGIGKAAIMPFHRWLPAAMVAPTPVSALLHAVAVVKAGVFTVLKVCVFIFGIDLLAVLPSTQFMLYLAGATVLLASLVAMRQDNLKARLAYSTVSQLGYVTIGALLATSAGVIGSSMHIGMHAFGKITLFFCAGAILVAAHQSKISEMHGLGRQMPITMAAFFLASLSIIGVPPTGGTWSKWFLLMGTMETEQWFLMAVLMISSLLNTAYLLPIPYRAFFPARGIAVTETGLKEAPLPSLIALSISTIGCVVLFVYPQPLYELARAILDISGLAYGK